jgi:uncharacterized protein YuzE
LYAHPDEQRKKHEEEQKINFGDVLTDIIQKNNIMSITILQAIPLSPIIMSALTSLVQKQDSASQQSDVRKYQPPIDLISQLNL